MKPALLSTLTRALSLFLLSALPAGLMAQDFEQIIQVAGAANTPDDQIVFGMLPGATDGLDDDEDVVPPAPPGVANTIAFSPDNIASKLIRDIREPANSKTWKVSVVKNNPDRGVTLSWDAAAWSNASTLPTLKLSGAVLAQDYDLTTPSPTGGVTIGETATLYISYGAPVIPAEGSLVVTSNTDGAQWRLLESDGADVIIDDGGTQVNLSSDTQGDPIWRAALASQVLDDLSPRDYTATFRDISVAYVTPNDMTASISNGVTTTLSADYSPVPASFVLSPQRISVDESGTTADVQIKLGAEPLADVSVSLSIGGDNPGAAQITAGSSLSFTAANYDSPQSVSIMGVDDSLAQDRGRRFTLELTVASDDNRYDGYVQATDDQVKGVTIDNDQPALLMSRVSGNTETDETGAQAQFNLVLATQPVADVTVDIFSTDTSEGTADPAQAIFTTANWSTPQTVTVTGQDDALTDGGMTYRVVANASSGDGIYDGRSKALRYVNRDDDVAAPAAGLVLLPASSLPFGLIAEGDSRTRSLTVFNTGTTDAQLNAAIENSSSAGAFTVEGAAAYDFTVPAGEGVQLEVAAAAKDTADGEQTRAALVLSEQADSVVLAALALSSLSVPFPQAGTLAIEPELMVLDASGNNETGEFDIVLDSTLRFGNMLLNLELPSFLTVTGVETNTDASSGWHFGYRSSGSLLTLGYADPDFDGTESTGIAPGENVILTVAFEVDTAASGEDVTAPITFLNAVAEDASAVYQLSWGEDTARRTAAETLSATDGLVAVSNKISLADLDVNGDENFNFADVLLVYRNMDFAQGGAGLNSSNGLLSQLIPAGTAYELTAQEIEDNITGLIEKGLNINGNASTDFADVLLIYRNLDFSLGGAGLNSANGMLNMLIPPGTSYDLSAAEIEQNIQNLMN